MHIFFLAFKNRASLFYTHEHISLIMVPEKKSTYTTAQNGGLSKGILDLLKGDRDIYLAFKLEIAFI